MTMLNLQKQNRNQWFAIIAIGFFLVLESQARVDVQGEYNNRLIILNQKIKFLEEVQMLIPLRGKMVVKIIPDLRQTQSGLYLAEKITEVPHRGTLEAIGKPVLDKDGKEMPWNLEKGEIVHFKRKWDNPSAEYFILLRDDIVAVEGKTGLRAVRDEVLVERRYTNKIGSSTLIIPETYGVQSNLEDFYGLVLSVGPDNRMGLKMGDKILYSRNEGVEVKYSEKVYFSLKSRAILAKI